MRGKMMKIIHIRKTGKNKYEIELSNKKIKTYDRHNRGTITNNRRRE